MGYSVELRFSLAVTRMCTEISVQNKCLRSIIRTAKLSVFLKKSIYTMFWAGDIIESRGLCFKTLSQCRGDQLIDGQGARPARTRRSSSLLLPVQ